MRLPFPVSESGSQFGSRNIWITDYRYAAGGYWIYGNFHTGVDWPKARGVPIPAAATGRVYLNEWSTVKGWMVGVEYRDGLGRLIRYRCHLLNGRSPWGIGQTIREGQTIGTTGPETLGGGLAANGYHLHFEIWVDGVAVDPIAFVASVAGGGAIPLENDVVTRDEMQQIAIVLLDTTIATAVGNRTVKQALSDALLFGRAATEGVKSVPGAVWGYPLQHPLAKRPDGSPAPISAGDFLRYEPAEHENTRRSVAGLIEQTADVDYDKVVAELKEAGLDPATFAVYAADEADRRERERLAED